jgi:ribosomal protein S18 acetylase RimI-like enzyme
MITYKDNGIVDLERLVCLFCEAGWTSKTSDLVRLDQMIKNSDLVVTAWDKNLMVGFARCTTDHVFNGQINNVVVDAKYRNRGIGKQLVTRIVDSNPKVTYILRSEAVNVAFYEKIGFRPTDYSLVFERKM